MTLAFEVTPLWQSSLGKGKGKKIVEEKRTHLRNAFYSFRSRANVLASEIPRDLPFFTVHDLTHLDALWETASTIAGDRYRLTPTEAFVLGGAFLVHDLAMSQAAYPEGLESLRCEPMSQDLLVTLLKRKFGRTPSQEEIENPDSDINEQLIGDLLRLNHAKQAERLPTAEWQIRGLERYHLIEDPELRETYGLLIGRIAHSHWWDVDRLIHEFPSRFGAPGDYPREWEVDALKVSILLRVADVSHLDERRSPSFLFTLRKPAGVSEAHWRFQNNLLQPRRDSDRLVYTVKRPFKIEDATAWWYCHDALKLVDNELRQVDSLLADLNREPRLAVRGVAKIESPERLAEVIQTEGWLPVDTKITVSNVAALARHIGGEQLYGNNLMVPLRELIQNASDAIRARRVIEDLPGDWGDITVRLGKDIEGEWIEVDDMGIGMSLPVLRGPLLDFGTSYWGSDLMISELPGLLAKGFESTGQYGIGFFSVFMWGDHVRVSTRRNSDAYQDTRILEFGSGLSVRPLVRKASESEFRKTGGTAIRIWLRRPIVDSNGRLSAGFRPGSYIKDLQQLLIWTCPSIDVNIWLEERGSAPIKIASANDWEQLNPAELGSRVALRHFGILKPKEKRRLKKIWNNIRPLRNSNGEILGRACIYDESYYSEDNYTVRQALRGAITVGGLRSLGLRSIFGILKGKSTRATRDQSLPVIDEMELARWASEQATLAPSIYNNGRSLLECSKLIRRLGGDTGQLPIAIGMNGWVSLDQIRNWGKIPNKVLLVTSTDFNQLQSETGLISLDEFTLVVDVYSRSPSWSLRNRSEPLPRPRQFAVAGADGEQRLLSYYTPKVSIIEALAELWATSLSDVLRTSDFTERAHKIGHRAERVIKVRADVIKRPT